MRAGVEAGGDDEEEGISETRQAVVGNCKLADEADCGDREAIDYEGGASLVVVGEEGKDERDDKGKEIDRDG